MSDKITAEEYRKLAEKQTGSKYSNKRVTVDGETFDSQREANRWCELRLLEKVGEIANLERQVPFPLNGKFGPIKTKTGKQAFYIADFTYIDWRINGVKVVEDSKGVETDVFKLKRAILAADNVEITTT